MPEAPSAKSTLLLRFVTILGLVLTLVGAGYAALIWYVYLRNDESPQQNTSVTQGDVPEVNVVPLKDGFFVLEGAGGNITVSTGPDGVLLVDSGDVEMTSSVLKALDSIDASDVVLVINTHSHGDHRGGNAGFASMADDIIAHRATYENMKTDTYTLAEPESLPTFVFDKVHKFTFNGQDITLTHLPLAHTNGDIVAYFKQADILSAGDAFITNGLPFISIGAGASLSSHLVGLQMFMEHVRENTTVIPGHGTVSVGKGEVQATYDQLKRIRDYLVWLKAHGVSKRFVLLAHPLYAWPLEKLKGQGWEKFWIRTNYAALPVASK